jgi:hypothetical protein
MYRAYLEQSQISVGIYEQRYGWIGPGMEISGAVEVAGVEGALGDQDDRPVSVQIIPPGGLFVVLGGVGQHRGIWDRLIAHG